MAAWSSVWRRTAELLVQCEGICTKHIQLTSSAASACPQPFVSGLWLVPI